MSNSNRGLESLVIPFLLSNLECFCSIKRGSIHGQSRWLTGAPYPVLAPLEPFISLPLEVRVRIDLQPLFLNSRILRDEVNNIDF